MSRSVLVAGGGMAGLAAACAASEYGASVTVLEKGDALGGSLALSNGFLVTYPDAVTLQAAVPGGDPALQALLAASLPPDASWLASLGVELTARPPVGGRSGARLDPRQAVAALSERLDGREVAVRLGTGLSRLLRRHGAVVGVEASSPAGTVEIGCDAVVVATGGFQGNAELLSRLCGLDSTAVYHRSNPWSTGDGLLACLEAGAATSASLATFYGHAMVAEPARLEVSTWASATQYEGCECVALDSAGRRFADESAGTGEEHLNQALARQPAKLGFYCGDAAIAGLEAPPGAGRPVAAVLEAAERLGAVVCRAPTLEELCSQLGGHGCDGVQALATLRSFQAAMSAGSPGVDGVARHAKRHPLAAAPFWAVKVRPSVTFTTGGLAVDETMAVLDRAGSSSKLAVAGAGGGGGGGGGAGRVGGGVDGTAPLMSGSRQRAVPGLFAAGADVGGLSAEGYAGGLASALVTGRTAGRSAALETPAAR